MLLNRIKFLTEHSCQLQRSSQQIIHQLYDAIVVMELKAFMMMQCAYMLRTVYKRGSREFPDNFMNEKTFVSL